MFNVQQLNEFGYYILLGYHHYNKGTKDIHRFQNFFVVICGFIVFFCCCSLLLFVMRILNVRSIPFKYFKVHNTALLTTGTVFYRIFLISLMKK